MILKLPELINLNDYINKERTNRFAAAKLKKELTELVAWQCKARRLKHLKQINKITFIWQEINKRRDPDNIMFGQKFIFDGLIKAGIIDNDGWKLWKNEPRIIHKFEIADKRGCIVMIK